METPTIKDLREQGLLLYEIISGSQTHGTATETSDIDKKGIYVLPEYYYALFYDHHGEHKYRGFVKDGDLSNELRLSSVPKGEKAVAHFVYNKDGYIAHCKEYKEYFEWVAKRNNDRYQTNVEHGGDYDSKNMCHSVRLLQMAIEIAEGKGINVWRENREELLSIKRGESNYQTILAKATDLVSQMEKAFDESDLPEEMDTSEFNEIIYKIRKSLYV